MAAEVATMTREDTFLDFDLWSRQQSWMDEDWADHENTGDAEEWSGKFCGRMQPSRTEARGRVLRQHGDGGYADETLAMNDQVPEGYKVTWYIANVWPRFVLWHDEKPLATALSMRTSNMSFPLRKRPQRRERRW